MTKPISPPSYIDTARFEEREVSVGETVKLPATLSIPKGAGPFPALALVHGSGPSDRDETIGPTKLFKDLAGGLASRGVVVLRYDKRTLLYPGELLAPKQFTVKEETLDDARAAVTLLGRSAKVDPKRLFVLGHSLGGMLAPRIAAEDSRVAGIVIMAGYTRPTEELAVAQIKYLAQGDAKQIAAVEESAKRIRDPNLDAAATVDFLGAKIPGSYWLDLRKYRPAEVAAALTVPLLLLQGGRDFQVTTVDFEGWKRALAGRPRTTFKLYPALNHLFVAGTGPSTPAEYSLPGHAPEALIADLVAWLSSAENARK